MTTVNLKYGQKEVPLHLHDALNYTVLKPGHLEGLGDPGAEIEKALSAPINSRPLEEIAAGKKDAVILASDISRPSPTWVIVPPIIKALNRAGIADRKISIIFGLGSHRRHTEEEKKQLVGEEVYNRVKCLDHDLNDCVPIGVTGRGTPVEVFRPVAEAGLIVGTGNIEFHYSAGYSGGYKALMPGVCSRQTIETNHKMLLDSCACAGRVAGNPLREDINEGGRMAGLSFIVNAVLNEGKEVVKIVAGDPDAAYLEGTAYIDQMYKCSIDHQADIVIASCGGYPKDINLYQAQKGLEHASYALKEGGTLVLLAECTEGLGESTFEDWMLRALSPDEPVQWIQERFVLGAHKAAVICSVLKKAQVYLVSNLEQDLVEKLFFSPSKSAQEALEKALDKAGDNAEILVLPFANSTLPCLD